MIRLRWRFDATVIIEFILAIGVMLGLGHLCWWVYRYGYLPLPFVYDVGDTFMDWFNPAYYAHHGGAYDVYRSIYAPMSFAILNLFSASSCYDYQPKDARACDMIGIGAICISFALCAILAGIAFYRRDRSTALFRIIGFGLGLPMLYALERGNLIMLALIAFIPFCGGLVRSKHGLALTAASMINMKSYMLFPVLGLAVKRDWRAIELCGIASIALYLMTLAIVGSGTPIELYDNLQTWFDATSRIVWGQINYSTTYAPFFQFDVLHYPIRGVFPAQTVDIGMLFFRVGTIATWALCFLCIMGAWLYPGEISFSRLAIFLVMQSFVRDNPGGYGHAFITFLVFLEKWENPRVGLAIILAYVLSIPVDFPFATLFHVQREAWLTGRAVDTDFGVTVGMLARPGLLMTVTCLLAFDSLLTFYRTSLSAKPSIGFLCRSRKTSSAELQVG